MPVTARQTIHLSLVSLKNSPKLRKELHKPALYDSRQKMGLLLRNERKFDISGEWKSRESFTLKSCKPEDRKKNTSNQKSKGGQRQQNRGKQQKTVDFQQNYLQCMHSQKQLCFIFLTHIEFLSEMNNLEKYT